MPVIWWLNYKIRMASVEKRKQRNFPNRSLAREHFVFGTQEKKTIRN